MSRHGPSDASRPERAPAWPPVDACFNAGLAATTSEKGRTALFRIRDAVGELRRNGVKITVEAVGGLCVELHGGPVAQSVRNNDRLKAIVVAAAGAQAAETAPRSRGKPREVQILDQIPDLILRAMAEGMFEERRAYYTEACQLRAAARVADAIAFLSQEMVAAGVDKLEEIVDAVKATRTAGGGFDFDERQRSACRHFLEEGLLENGFSIDAPSGEIINRVFRTVAKSGVAEVLRKVAGLDEHE